MESEPPQQNPERTERARKTMTSSALDVTIMERKRPKEVKIAVGFLPKLEKMRV